MDKQSNASATDEQNAAAHVQKRGAKVIIAGSRTVEDYAKLAAAVAMFHAETDLQIAEVVSGGAQGVDKLGERYARLNSLPCRKFPANWTAHGKAAGPLRNEEMAKYADALIALWDGKSRGTADMLRRAGQHGLTVLVHPCT